MRYAESQFGEDAIVLGEFITGATVTCVLYNASTSAVIPVSSNACTEINSTGVFKFLLSNIVTKPTSFTQIVYIMTDSTTGRTHKGKVVVGGYPSDSAIRRFAGAVHIDTVNGTAGTTFPIGTPDEPVSNVANAKTIADNLVLRAYELNGSITLTTNHTNWTIRGKDPAQDSVTVNAGVSVDSSSFYRVAIAGDLTGDISAEECLFSGTVTGVDGILLDCGVNGTLRVASGATLRCLGLNSTSLSGSVIDFNTPGAATQVLISDMVGYWTVDNMNINSIFGAVLRGANLTIDTPHTNGTVHIYGYGEASTGTNDYFLLVDYVLKTSSVPAIASDVWDVATSSHTTAGTFGKFVQSKLLTVAKFLGPK